MLFRSKLEGEFPTEVHLTLKDGRKLISVHEWPKGSKAAPFTWDEYWAKFEACCTGVLEGEPRHALRQSLEQFPALADAGALMRHAAFAPITAR